MYNRFLRVSLFLGKGAKGSLGLVVVGLGKRQKGCSKATISIH